MTTNVKCLSDTVIISEYWVLSMLHILYRMGEPRSPSMASHPC